MRVVLFRIRNHSVYSNFLNTFTHKNNSTHQLVCVPCSAVNVTSMWAEKDCPLYWSHKHARMHEGGREGGRRGWKQTGGRREGRQTDRNIAFVVSSPWDCSKCFTFQPMAEIHRNLSGKQLFWYPNCIDTCIFLCREYVIILFKAIYSKHLHIKTNSTHQFVCIQCSAVNVRVISMWTE